MKLIRVGVSVLVVVGFVASVAPGSRAQQRPGASKELIAARNAMEKELAELAIVDRKVMVPMRDGVRLATDVYRPTLDKVPIIFVRTPYNFNFWDVRNGVPRDMSARVGGGQARVRLSWRTSAATSSPRGTTTSCAPKTDGYDAIQWIGTQPWSNGKVGTIGCSSTAEWQMGVAALGDPGVRGDESPRGSAPGVGRVVRTTSRATGIAAARCRCCSSPGSTASRTRCGPCSRQHVAGGSGSGVEIVRPGAAAAARGLVEGAVAPARCRTSSGTSTGPRGIFADRAEVSTGGAMIQRTPNDRHGIAAGCITTI